MKRLAQAGLAAALLIAATTPAMAHAAPTNSSSTPDSPHRSPDAKCALTEPGRHTITIQSGGKARSAVVFMPKTDQKHTKLPLVLDLHGSSSTSEVQLRRSQLEQVAAREKFVVAAPQGAIPSSGSYSWNVPYTSTDQPGAPDDVAFLKDLVTELTSTCADDKKVYGTGYSGGGRMLSQFACEHPDVLTAIAPVAGLRAGSSMPAPEGGYVPDPATCQPSEPLPVMTFSGTADPTNPFEDGGSAYWRYGALDASDRWAELNHCKKSATEEVTSTVSLVGYTACRSHAEVFHYVVEGGGHTWPGGDPAEFNGSGPVTQDIQASELMWDFFHNSH
ncbi:extracellular catalytic domain type 1 short-chain-length polyhydroxyalkanoate depolymerase [Arthrobacter sp. TMS2-4]